MSQGDGCTKRVFWMILKKIIKIVVKVWKQLKICSPIPRSYCLFLITLCERTSCGNTTVKCTRFYIHSYRSEADWDFQSSLSVLATQLSQRIRYSRPSGSLEYMGHIFMDGSIAPQTSQDTAVAENSNLDVQHGKGPSFMGEDECDEGKTRSSILSEGKLQRKQEISLSLFNLHHTVSSMPESPWRIFKPCRKDKGPFFVLFFLSLKNKARWNLQCPPVNTYEYSKCCECQDRNININPCWNAGFFGQLLLRNSLHGLIKGCWSDWYFGWTTSKRHFHIDHFPWGKKYPLYSHKIFPQRHKHVI